MQFLIGVACRGRVQPPNEQANEKLNFLPLFWLTIFSFILCFVPFFIFFFNISHSFLICNKVFPLICTFFIFLVFISFILNIKLSFFLQLLNSFTSMASKPINIRWFRTGSSHTEKPCIVSHYRQFSTNIEVEMINQYFLLARASGFSGPIKLVLIL